MYRFKCKEKEDDEVLINVPEPREEGPIDIYIS